MFNIKEHIEDANLAVSLRMHDLAPPAPPQPQNGLIIIDWSKFNGIFLLSKIL